MDRPTLGGPWRGCGQGRARGRGRRYARLGTAVRGRRERRESVGRVLPRRQPGKTLGRGGVRDPGGPSPRAPSRHARRRADRELQGRRPEEIRPRLREPQNRQPAPRLLLRHRLRPDRPLCPAARLRLHGSGHRRRYGHHGSARRTADQGRHSRPPIFFAASTPRSAFWRRCAAATRPAQARISIWR